MFTLELTHTLTGFKSAYFATEIHQVAEYLADATRLGFTPVKIYYDGRHGEKLIITIEQYEFRDAPIIDESEVMRDLLGEEF